MRTLLKIAIVVTFCFVAVGSASGALVKVNGLILQADGGFTPRELPRRAFAPIDFEGWAGVKAVGGGVPPAVEQVVLDFDRDGRLTTRGLAACTAAKVAEATPAQARSLCPRAVIGTGQVEAAIALPGQAPLRVRSPLTLFNGPREGGDATVVFHARITAPAVQTFAVTIPVEKRGGGYSYRAVVAIPSIAGGHGSLTRVEVKVGKRYRLRGDELSYVSARCSDGILETHGRFTFAEGTIIDGTVEKPCRALPDA